MTEDIIIALSLDEVCRLCLRTNEILIDVFDEIYKKDTKTLADRIHFLAPIKIYVDDGLPFAVCKNCKEEVDRFYEFRLKILETDKVLRRNSCQSLPEDDNPDLQLICVEEDGTQVFVLKETSDIQVHNTVEIVPVNHSNKAKQKINTNTEDVVVVSKQRKINSNGVIFNENYVMPLSELRNNNLKKCEIIDLTETDVSNENKPEPNEEDSVNEHSKDELTCQLCLERFSDMNSLTEHIESHLSVLELIGKQDDNIKQEYQCKHCGLTVKSLFILQSHVSTKHFKGRLWCFVCSRLFSTRQNFIVHQRRHLGILPFECPTCDRKFVTSALLKRHKMAHNIKKVQKKSTEKKFSCSVCGYVLRSKALINRHMLYHTGERKFKCNYCGKQYFESGHLKTHERTHTGIKPYACHICPKMFITAPKLTRHIKIHEKYLESSNNIPIKDSNNVEMTPNMMLEETLYSENKEIINNDLATIKDESLLQLTDQNFLIVGHLIENDENVQIEIIDSK